MSASIECRPVHIVVGSDGDDTVVINNNGSIDGAVNTKLDGDTLRINCNDSAGASGNSMFSLMHGRMTTSIGGQTFNMVNGRMQINGASVWTRGGTLHIKAPATMKVVVNNQPVGTLGEAPPSNAPLPLHCIATDNIVNICSITVEGSARLSLGSARERPQWSVADKLHISGSGAACILMGCHLVVEKLTVDLSGSSSLRGNNRLYATSRVGIDTSGASSATGIIAPRGGRADASGASSVQLAAAAREAVRRNATGAASVTVRVLSQSALRKVASRQQRPEVKEDEARPGAQKSKRKRDGASESAASRRKTDQ